MLTSGKKSDIIIEAAFYLRDGGGTVSGFDGFLGNEELKARLERDIAAGKLAHAYMIEGPEGSGKRTLARLIAAAAACRESDPPCMKCVSCDKIMREQSPDVITVGAEAGKVQLGVDVIRRLREDAVFAANDLDTKTYIFPEADTMNVQAQNALLKLLEEPPDGVRFLLLTTNSQGLLATIRSRAPLLRTEALEDDVIADWLGRNDQNAMALKRSDPQAFAVAVRLSSGSLGRAMALCDPEESEECMRLWGCADKLIRLLADRTAPGGDLRLREFASRLLSNIPQPKSKKGSKETSAKSSPAKQREELAAVYDLTSDAARDLIAVRLSENMRPLFFPDRSAAAQLADRFPMTLLTRLLDAASSAVRGLSGNMNTGLVMSRFALDISGK